jgi:hexosaminidase
MKPAFFLAISVFLLFNFGCRTNNKLPELEIWWEVATNQTINDTTRHKAIFTLINRGKVPIADSNWTLHWNQSPRFVIGTEGPARVENINGDFYRMMPKPGFSLKPGDTLRIAYWSLDFIIKASDGPLGIFLVVGGGADSQVIPVNNTRILPFLRPEQYTRSPADEEPVSDPPNLFEQNEGWTVLPPNEAFPFIPAPAQFESSPGRFTFATNIHILCDPAFEAEGSYLVEAFREQHRIRATLLGKSQPSVYLIRDAAVQAAEGYKLVSDPQQGVRISASTAAGIFYGIQSLLSQIQYQPNSGQTTIGACNITDQPGLPYRGLHIDVGRNFQQKETILRLLDLMGRYKLNRLLFNLTEDEGWRLAIKNIPELTEVGGRRGYQHRDSLYLQPAYGSGANPDDPASPGNGHYSRADFKEILQFAHRRHIEVIPEINLPGHARAAIKAMELRAARLKMQGDVSGAEALRLIDPADASVYLSAQGYTDNTACVCNGNALRFFETVVDDIILQYKEAGVPLTTFHTGGDEVPATAWTASPLCRDLLLQKPAISNTRNLQGLFFQQMIEVLRRRGLRTGAWEEAVMIFEGNGKWRPNPEHANKDVFPYIWNNLWGNQDLGYRLANAGYPVILCHVTNLYFDLAYSKDPREPGLYWAGFVDAEDPFSFQPLNIFQSTVRDNMGKLFDPAKEFVGMERLTPTGRKNIIGIQAQIWSETIKGRDMLEYYYLPKLVGYAQRAWQGQPDWKEERDRKTDFNRLLNTLVQVEIPFLEKHRGGYHYRIPPPGIGVQQGKIVLNSGYPGFEIRYTTDGRTPTQRSPLYQQPIDIAPGTLKAACFNRYGRSGNVSSYSNPN